jgi:hypothetical protein
VDLRRHHRRQVQAEELHLIEISVTASKGCRWQPFLRFGALSACRDRPLLHVYCLPIGSKAGDGSGHSKEGAIHKAFLFPSRSWRRWAWKAWPTYKCVMA